MKIDVVVTSPKGEYNFSCFVHLTKNEKDRFIDREFYETSLRKVLEWNNEHPMDKCHYEIPQGGHCELELLIPINNGIEVPNVHIHLNPQTGKNFVCWTGSLPTISSAKSMFLDW